MRVLLAAVLLALVVTACAEDGDATASLPPPTAEPIAASPVPIPTAEGAQRATPAPEDAAVEGQSPGALLLHWRQWNTTRGGWNGMVWPLGAGTLDALDGREPIDLGYAPRISASPDGRLMAVMARGDLGGVPPAGSAHSPPFEAFRIYDLAEWRLLRTIEITPGHDVSIANWSADGARFFAWRTHCPRWEWGGCGAVWEREVWEIDVLAGTALRLAALDLDIRARHLVAPDGASPARAYVLAVPADGCCGAGRDDPFIAALDLDTGAVVAEIALPGLLVGVQDHWLGDESRGAAYYPATALAPDGSRLYVVDSVEDRVIVVDLEGLRIERTAGFAEPRSPLAGLGSWLWSRVARAAEAKGGPAYERQAAVTPDGRYLLITGTAPRERPEEVEGDESTSRRQGLVIIDTATLSVAAMHPTILDFAISTDGRWLAGAGVYWDPDVADGDGTGAWVGHGLQLIDLRSLDVVLRLWPGMAVREPAIAADSRYAYVTAEGPGWVEARRTARRTGVARGCRSECLQISVVDLHRGEIVAERIFDDSHAITSLSPVPPDHW